MSRGQNGDARGSVFRRPHISVGFAVSVWRHIHLVRYRPTTHEQATQTDDNGVVPPLYSRLPPPTSCPLSRRDVLADIHQRRDNIASAIINDEYVPQARDQPRHHISEMPDLTVDYTWLLYTNNESSD